MNPDNQIGIPEVPIENKELLGAFASNLGTLVLTALTPVAARGVGGAAEAGAPSMRQAGTGRGALQSAAESSPAWSPGKAASSKLPSSWGEGVPTRKGEGVRWTDPSNKGNGVRIDRGNPANSQPTQRVDHVIVRQNGQVIGRNGRPINGSIADNAVEAHIPLDEWKKWSSWSSP